MPTLKICVLLKSGGTGNGYCTRRSRYGTDFRAHSHKIPHGGMLLRILTQNTGRSIVLTAIAMIPNSVIAAISSTVIGGLTKRTVM